MHRSCQKSPTAVVLPGATVRFDSVASPDHPHEKAFACDGFVEPIRSPPHDPLAPLGPDSNDRADSDSPDFSNDEQTAHDGG